MLPLIGLGACNKTINDLQQNPNQATSASPSLILGTVLTDISGTGSAGTLGGSGSWDDVHKYNQYYLGAYAYYGDNQYSWSSGSFDPYLVLKNVVQMEKEAASQGIAAVNAYEAIGKFLRAWYFYNMTSLMGDIPESEALQSIDNATPKYDTQKDVFTYVLNTLDSANSHFASLIASGDATISGSAQDIYYAGDLTQWQKAVNTFKLRVLLSLSKRATDGGIDVAGQFKTIFDNPATYPVFESQDDDMKFTYIQTYNQYPLNVSNFGSTASRYAMAKTYVQTLTDLQDPRVYVTCEPAWALVDSLGYVATDFKAFVGESTGTSIATIEQKSSARLISFINRNRYYNTYTGDADVLLGYKELCFNIAEAMNRGWITGDAETWYVKGITESMSFYGISSGKTAYTAYFLKSGDLSNIAGYTYTFDFDSYLNKEGVKYAGGTDGLEQILLQKYIAMFQNSGWEAYYNYRRTGVPAFEGGTGIGNNGVIPSRWAYPTSEQNQNAANWKAALTSQSFSTDDLNGKMWLIK